MSIIYTLFLFTLGIHFFSKDKSKKSYITIGTIITAIVVATDIPVIISMGFISYLGYYGWQPLTAYALLLIYTFVAKSSLRKFSFELKKNKKKKETIATSKSRGIQSIILAIVILLIGCGLIPIKLLDIYDIPLVAFVGTGAGFIVLLAFGIIMTMRSNEKMILLVLTNKLNVYSKKIEDKFSFNYMNSIRDIDRYYIIERVATVYFSGELKETHYVWLLKTENLNNYDINNLPMEKEGKYWYNEMVDEISTKTSKKFFVEVANNKIVKINRR